MIRNSLRYVSFKDRKTVVKDLKPITAANRVAAEAALTAFETKVAVLATAPGRRDRPLPGRAAVRCRCQDSYRVVDRLQGLVTQLVV